MLTFISEHLELLENLLWTFFGVPLVMLLGLYLSFKSNFFQIRQLPTVFKTFFGFLFVRKKQGELGVHPLKAFFCAVGGCVGIGNIVGICTAVQLGGPGALFWIWVTAFAGMILKYSEVYLGLRYRQPNDKGGYNGGPMYFLKEVFKQNMGSSAGLRSFMHLRGGSLSIQRHYDEHHHEFRCECLYCHCCPSGLSDFRWKRGSAAGGKHLEQKFAGFRFYLCGNGRLGIIE